MLHFAEFIWPRHAKTEVLQVIAAVGMSGQAMVPIIHPQIEAVGFAVVGQFKADNLSGKFLPFIGVLHAKSDVAQLSDLDHLDLPKRLPPSEPRRHEFPTQYLTPMNYITNRPGSKRHKLRD